MSDFSKSDGIPVKVFASVWFCTLIQKFLCGPLRPARSSPDKSKNANELDMLRCSSAVQRTQSQVRMARFQILSPAFLEKLYGHPKCLLSRRSAEPKSL
jgi:hypothetical protein